MRLGDALVCPARERRQIASVALGHEWRHVTALLIDRARHRPRRTQRLHGQLRRRRRREALVDEHLGVIGVIDHQQRHVIEEVRLPQFRRDPHVVAAAAWRELIAANPHPVLRLGHSRRVPGVDAKAEW
jgi:hypothetical protein